MHCFPHSTMLYFNMNSSLAPISHVLLYKNSGMLVLISQTFSCAHQINRVISNSFGFGGTNACLCFDRYEK